MPTFIVERYVQAQELQALIRQEREALTRIAAHEAEVRHLRSTFVRDDELCLSFFEGPSLSAVRTANERAGLPFERISEAIDVNVNEPTAQGAIETRGGAR